MPIADGYAGDTLAFADLAGRPPALPCPRRLNRSGVDHHRTGLVEVARDVMWSARLTAINLFGSCLNSLAAASIAASASGRVDSAEEFGRCSTGRKRRRQIVKGEGVRRRRGAAILSVSTPRCAVCKAGHVSSQGRQRTYPLARFKSALFTTKPAPKKREGLPWRQPLGL